MKSKVLSIEFDFSKMPALNVQRSLGENLF